MANNTRLAQPASKQQDLSLVDRLDRSLINIAKQWKPFAALFVIGALLSGGYYWWQQAQLRNAEAASERYFTATWGDQVDTQALQALAAEHPASAAGARAALALIETQQEAKDYAGMIATATPWAQQKKTLPNLIRVRFFEVLGYAYEQQQQWQDAGTAYESAYLAFPEGTNNLVNAVRCFDAAGAPARSDQLLTASEADSEMLRRTKTSEQVWRKLSL